MGENKKGSWLKEKAVPRRKQDKGNGAQQLETSKVRFSNTTQSKSDFENPNFVETDDECSKVCDE